jgi:HAE1 family hydrophobic/amphiphilic exporter-1
MHALAQLCVRRPVFATMLILSLMVVGIFCYFGLGVDLFPKVDLPTVAVVIANPGASPEEIETEISRKVEDAVNTISQIDEVRSTSSEGQALVLITFELSKNGDVASQEVQNKVNSIVPQPKDETSKQGRTVMTFEPVPAGGRQDYYVGFQVDPTTVGRRSQTASLLDGDLPVATVRRTFTVFP